MFFSLGQRLRQNLLEPLGFASRIKVLEFVWSNCCRVIVKLVGNIALIFLHKRFGWLRGCYRPKYTQQIQKRIGWRSGENQPTINSSLGQVSTDPFMLTPRSSCHPLLQGNNSPDATKPT